MPSQQRKIPAAIRLLAWAVAMAVGLLAIVQMILSFL